MFTKLIYQNLLFASCFCTSLLAVLQNYLLVRKTAALSHTKRCCVILNGGLELVTSNTACLQHYVKQ